jgi:hypothetical protein
LVEASKQGLVEENIPEAVGHWFKSDEVSIESLGEELLFGVKSERAGVADTTDFEVAWIFGWSNTFGVRTRRGLPSGSGGLVIESLVRSDVVIDSSEGVVKAEVGGGGLGGSSFEGSVHAFMSAVLLRFPGVMRWCVIPSWSHQTFNRVRPWMPVSKRGAVIAANGIGKSVLPKQPQKLSVNAVGSHVRQCFATKEVTTEVVDDGQGIAVETISGEELAFEIDGPNLVGCGGVEGSCSGMLPAAASSARPNAVMPLENVENRAARRQSPVGKTNRTGCSRRECTR